MKIKNILTAIIIGGSFCLTNLIQSSPVKAKVIEPEIVKTETWTASYFIDDDMDTLYPYIDCQADIYNDGTVKCYFWNTHEWTGFATVKHHITTIATEPVVNVSMEYFFKNEKGYARNGNIVNTYPCSKNCSEIDYAYWSDIDLSYYPNDYIYTNNNYKCFSGKSSSSFYWHCDSLSTSILESSIYRYGMEIALSELPINEKREITFTPKIDITKEYTFRFLEHDIIVSPEILSANVIATPQLTAQDKYIQELEAENAMLKSMTDIDSIMRFDTDGNGMIDAKDASTILLIYAINSTGGNISKLSEIQNNK